MRLLMDLLEGLLEQVFSLIAIAGHMTQISKQNVPVAANKLRERGAVPSKVRAQQAFVCHSRQG